jgi:glucuronate isomerase
MTFLNDDFLLETKTAKILYHEYAVNMPIIDYHCHLDPSEIYLDKRFDNLAEAWLGGDHYKWRIMRANGVSEDKVTGVAPAWEKFRAFAEVLPRAIGSPIFHWAHMELLYYFDCNYTLNPETAKDIWEMCNDQLQNDDELSVRGILRNSHVDALCTTDDPVDDLQWHRKLAEDGSMTTEILPCWRPGIALDVSATGFADYVKMLEDATGISINSYVGMKTALLKSIEYFKEQGCLASDHGIPNLFYAPATDEQLNDIFTKALRGEAVTEYEADQYRYELLLFCAKEYARLGWVMQLHYGTLRNVNTSMFKKLGPDTGFDCSVFTGGTSGLAKFLDTLEMSGSLPKTILFSIDPNDNPALTTLSACFSEAGVKGKVQQGSAWWFNDTYYGMDQQLKFFAEQGVLGNFLGMLTDSRSFLSFTRHEYFRRLLCNLLGGWADSGKYPNDTGYLGSLVQDICYNNVKDYFGF